MKMGGKGGWGWDEKDGKKVWKKYIVIIIDKINKNCTKNIKKKEKKQTLKILIVGVRMRRAGMGN